ncbi:MAG: sphingosine kinase, partial [Candidatus Thermoplasmatota archaeon]
RVRWAQGERFFIGVFGIGFMAKCADLANRRFKRFGAKGYTLAVFPELAHLRAPMTRLVMDDRVVEEPLVLVAVCNTRHMGGAMEVAPMALPDDGVLEVVALRAVGRVGLLRLFPKIFSGAHVGHERVLLGRAKHVRIEPREPSPLLGDGEIYGSTPVDVDVVPQALRVLL